MGCCWVNSSDILKATLYTVVCLLGKPTLTTHHVVERDGPAVDKRISASVGMDKPDEYSDKSSANWSHKPRGEKKGAFVLVVGFVQKHKNQKDTSMFGTFQPPAFPTASRSSDLSLRSATASPARPPQAAARL